MNRPEFPKRKLLNKLGNLPLSQLQEVVEDCLRIVSNVNAPTIWRQEAAFALASPALRSLANAANAAQALARIMEVEYGEPKRTGSDLGKAFGFSKRRFLDSVIISIEFINADEAKRLTERWPEMEEDFRKID